MFSRTITEISFSGEPLPSARWSVIHWIAVAFWAYIWIVQRLVGSLRPDELYFSHMFWMMHQGLHQYTDFYSYHLPTYFWMLSPLVGDDLSFVYILRATSLIAVFGYGAMTRPLLWPFVLIFVIFGRMAEIRPDTFGLLLMNAGWFALFKRRTVIGALLAGLSPFFSARAAVVGVGFALVCFHVSDRSQVRRLMLLALVSAVLAGAAFLAFHDSITAVLRACFLEPGRVLPRMPLAMRFGSPQRLVLVAMILIAFLSSLSTYARHPRNRDAVIIAGACATQLALIVVDPAPWEYVYGWAMIPVINGLLLVGSLVNIRSQALLSGAAAAGALLICAGSLIVYVTRFHAPRAQSDVHLVPNPSVSPVRRMSTRDLLAAIASNRPGEVWDQIAVRRELCRRIKGRVAAAFAFQPICLRDATYDWSAVTWSPQTLEQIAARKRAQVLIWGDWLRKPHHLPAGYVVGEGFAVTAREMSRSPGAPAQASSR